MDIDQLYPSKFLRCSDLNGTPLRVTIQSSEARGHRWRTESHHVVHERNASPWFSIKPTPEASQRRSARTKQKTGSARTSCCSNIVDFNGESVEAISIRAATNLPPQPPLTNNEATPFDDDFDL